MVRQQKNTFLKRQCYCWGFCFLPCQVAAVELLLNALSIEHDLCACVAESRPTLLSHKLMRLRVLLYVVKCQCNKRRNAKMPKCQTQNMQMQLPNIKCQVPNPWKCRCVRTSPVPVPILDEHHYCKTFNIRGHWTCSLTLLCFI